MGKHVKKYRYLLSNHCRMLLPALISELSLPLLDIPPPKMLSPVLTDLLTPLDEPMPAAYNLGMVPPLAAPPYRSLW
jgi:hypothetical protein